VMGWAAIVSSFPRNRPSTGSAGFDHLPTKAP
jgi:hypothetical protein